MLCRQQRVLVFTDDQCLATGTKVSLNTHLSFQSLFALGLLKCTFKRDGCSLICPHTIKSPFHSLELAH